MSSQMAAQNENSGTPFLENFRRDVRYAVRTLLRDAGFATFAILIVGLGVGASCTIFSVVNTLLIRPLPFRDPGRLVALYQHNNNKPGDYFPIDAGSFCQGSPAISQRLVAVAPGRTAWTWMPLSPSSCCSEWLSART